jgi:mannose/fructose/N-acetylgalactosamine-specific phosphotransferase system component IID
VNKNRNTIGVLDLLAVFRRALLIQASWSFDRMQTIGFAYALEPALRKLYPEPAEYENRLKAHMEYFNTQPYLASFILGAAVRLEQDRAAGNNATTDVSGLKTTLMAPLGALGDSFFWGALKPMAAALAVAVILTGSWWAPLLFLVIFNSWHLGLCERWRCRDAYGKVRFHKNGEAIQNIVTRSSGRHPGTDALLEYGVQAGIRQLQCRDGIGTDHHAFFGRNSKERRFTG